ncbi:MAG: hypothetical protein CL840_08810 [Crocinitomicaceae bacterium]|nr:hypothetical protein [Crocinitomicaceae bacterium]
MLKRTFLLALLFFACQYPSFSNELDSTEANGLLEQASELFHDRPDSALHILNYIMEYYQIHLED